MINCDEITNLASKGLNIADIAYILNVSPEELKEVIGIKGEEYKAYMKGISILKCKIQEKIISLAERGSSSAITELKQTIQNNISDATI